MPSYIQAEFAPVVDRADLGLSGWIKHDGASLFLAFNLTDDTLYGLQTARWTPKANPAANALNQTGWPWFGDEMEVLLNAAGGPPAGGCTAESKVRKTPTSAFYSCIPTGIFMGQLASFGPT